MIDTKALLNTISSVYAAPGGTDGWATALGDTTRLVGGKIASYMLVDPTSHSIKVSKYHGYSVDDIEAYKGMGGAQRDIRVQHHDNLIPGKVFREFEYVPDKKAYDASEWIRRDLDKYGIYWNMTARISTHGLWNDVIAVNRLKFKGPYRDEEKAALQTILPHLSRAAELHRTVARLEDIYDAVLSVLDKLLVGLIVLDTRSRVVLTNAAASRAADESGALSIRADSHLHATDVAIDIELQALIAATAKTIEADGTSDGGQLILPSRAMGENLLVELMPIRDDGLPDADNIRGVAVFIVDPNRAHILNTAGLSRIFKLSSSEGAILNALVNGATPREIAEERRTSVGTVRGQIKSIFGKTGAGSQSDLLRLAAKVDPPIARD